MAAWITSSAWPLFSIASMIGLDDRSSSASDMMDS
jgi:hypothetical protein